MLSVKICHYHNIFCLFLILFTQPKKGLPLMVALLLKTIYEKQNNKIVIFFIKLRSELKLKTHTEIFHST